MAKSSSSRPPRAEERECRVMKHILDTYERASGQAINFQKSEIYFSKNTTSTNRAMVTSFLGVTESLGTGKYLGMPSMIGRNKKAVFSYLRDRLWKKIQHWSGRHLSKTGHEVLVKSVAQAIPTYCMSTFLLPTSLSEEMERMINSFWWGSNRGGGRGINWLSWEKLSIKKEFGGMGFRHFYGFNIAMLGKHGWRIATNQDTILARVFKSRYFPQGEFMRARLGHNHSFVWHNIHSSRVLINHGMRWQIGDGSRINVWGDPWLCNKEDPFIKSPTPHGLENLCVKDLIEPSTMTWRADYLSAILNPTDVQTVRSIPLIHIGGDRMIWRHHKSIFNAR